MGHDGEVGDKTDELGSQCMAHGASSHGISVSRPASQAGFRERQRVRGDVEKSKMHAWWCVVMRGGAWYVVHDDNEQGCATYHITQYTVCTVIPCLPTYLRTISEHMQGLPL